MAVARGLRSRPATWAAGRIPGKGDRPVDAVQLEAHLRRIGRDGKNRADRVVVIVLPFDRGVLPEVLHRKVIAAGPRSAAAAAPTPQRPTRRQPGAGPASSAQAFSSPKYSPSPSPPSPSCLSRPSAGTSSSIHSRQPSGGGGHDGSGASPRAAPSPWEALASSGAGCSALIHHTEPGGQRSSGITFAMVSTWFSWKVNDVSPYFSR